MTDLSKIPYEELVHNMGGSVLEKCPYCGIEEGPWEMDHIVPKSVGGPDTPENKQLVCWRCNKAKSVSSDAEYREWIKKLVEFHTK